MGIRKSISALVLISAIVLGCAGCSAKETKQSNSPTKSTENSTTELKRESESVTVSDSTSADVSESESDTVASEEKKTSDILVVYFSRTGEQYNVGVIDKGNTAIVAEFIADRTGADLWEVLPVDDHYPMTYSELTDVAKKEQKDDARPQYKGEVPDLSSYSTIFIGAPVWWGDWPMIMYTFFENNLDGLAGKTLIPFSTHEGSGLSGFDKKLSKACPDATVKDGLAIKGQDAQNSQDSVKEKVEEWLSELGI